MKDHNKYQIIASALLILAVVVFTEIKAESYPDGEDQIIEVCSEGVVYVPPGTKLVKCMGKIKKVIGVIPYQPDLRIGENCLCWNCCDGACGVIISCDGEPGELFDENSTANGSLCLLLLDCD